MEKLHNEHVKKGQKESRQAGQPKVYPRQYVWLCRHIYVVQEV